MPTTRLAHRAALKDTRVNIRLQELADSLPDVIRMGRGDPDFDTPAHIVRAGQEALAKGATHYTHAQGILPLRQAIAKDILARGGASYTPDQIVVTPGAQQALFTVAHEVGFPYQQMALTYAKIRCARCGEYVLDSFVRTMQGQPMCIPCSHEPDVAGGVPGVETAKTRR